MVCVSHAYFTKTNVHPAYLYMMGFTRGLRDKHVQMLHLTTSQPPALYLNLKRLLFSVSHSLFSVQWTVSNIHPCKTLFFNPVKHTSYAKRTVHASKGAETSPSSLQTRLTRPRSWSFRDGAYGLPPSGPSDTESLD